MNKLSDRAFDAISDVERAQQMKSIWLEEDFEELQEESPWEIFSSEMDNWAAINIGSVEL